jgi:hypothetical protein
MKTSIFILGLVISSIFIFGQSGQLSDEQINRSGAIQLLLVDSLEQVTELANKDIASGTPFLLLQGGLAPVAYAIDKKFENKFNVYYYESGCTGPKEKFAVAYNKIIFAHLTEKYAGKWKKEVREDVIGLRK